MISSTGLLFGPPCIWWNVRKRKMGIEN